jgi:hypothetical protein
MNNDLKYVFTSFEFFGNIPNPSIVFNASCLFSTQASTKTLYVCIYIYIKKYIFMHIFMYIY